MHQVDRWQTQIVCHCRKHLSLSIPKHTFFGFRSGQQVGWPKTRIRFFYKNVRVWRPLWIATLSCWKWHSSQDKRGPSVTKADIWKIRMQPLRFLTTLHYLELQCTSIWKDTTHHNGAFATDTSREHFMSQIFSIPVPLEANVIL